jgi:hypothetical protein
MTKKKQENESESKIKKSIIECFENLAMKYGKSFLALEGIFIVDNKIIKISNLGGLK